MTPAKEGTAARRELVADAELGASFSCCGPRVTWDDASDEDAALRVGVLGGYRTYRAEPDGAVKLVSEQAIPERVSPGADHMAVGSPWVHALGRAASGRMLFATEPEPLGKRRLRTVLLDPDGPAGSQAVECWVLFPESERVVDSGFLILDGAPVLVVTTTSADKLSLNFSKRIGIDQGFSRTNITASGDLRDPTYPWAWDHRIDHAGNSSKGRPP